MEKKTLHIIRSQPDEFEEKLIFLSKNPEDKVINLYEKDVDWEKLVEDIFIYDKVISWW